MPMILSPSVGLNWHVSRTCEGGACVMVAADGDMVLFGNTTEPGGPVLSYTRDEWHEFVAGVKLGHFEGIA
jgi:predicted secreted Zn-dependent protease